MRKAWCILREHVTNVHLCAGHMVLMFLKVPETLRQRHARRMAAQPGTKAPSHPSLTVWSLSSGVSLGPDPAHSPIRSILVTSRISGTLVVAACR